MLVLLGAAAAALETGGKLKRPGCATAAAGAGSEGTEPGAAAEKAPGAGNEKEGIGELAKGAG